MTEQPNTNEIRARLEHHDGVSWLELRNFVVTLTETLDAARAERDKIDREHNRLKTTFDAGRRALLSRAEAAEAELARRDEAIRVQQNAAAYAEPRDLS